MKNQSMVITSIYVKNLLGLYDHRIDFSEEWEYVIIYGPNGVGKTKLLEAVNALSNLNIRQLNEIPFTDLVLSFSDRSELRASRLGVEQEELLIEGSGLSYSSPEAVKISLKRPEQGIVVAEPRGEGNLQAHFADWIEATTSYTHLSSDFWQDTTDGEIVDTDTLMERFPQGQHLSSSDDDKRIPDNIREFCEGLEVHLIETQRLLTKAARGPRSRPDGSTLSFGGVAGAPRGRRSRTSTVSEYSDDLKRRLGRALAANSRITQQLDRTFPRRVLENPTPQHVDDSMVRDKYEKQNELRGRLANLSVIGGEADLPLPKRDLEDWERHVLWTSLADTDQKLSSFDEILDKVTLLEEIINRRFLRKRIRVNADEGLRIFSSPLDQILDPEGLSSGEQHELILIYDLLFNVAPGSTVLIDEPEISLHVAWQQRFLDDIASISRLSALRFVIATHSPQIIHKSWSRTVQLGPDSDF